MSRYKLMSLTRHDVDPMSYEDTDSQEYDDDDDEEEDEEDENDDEREEGEKNEETYQENQENEINEKKLSESERARRMLKQGWIQVGSRVFWKYWPLYDEQKPQGHRFMDQGPSVRMKYVAKLLFLFYELFNAEEERNHWFQSCQKKQKRNPELVQQCLLTHKKYQATESRGQQIALRLLRYGWDEREFQMIVQKRKRPELYEVDIETVVEQLEFVYGAICLEQIDACSRCTSKHSCEKSEWCTWEGLPFRKKCKAKQNVLKNFDVAFDRQEGEIMTDQTKQLTAMLQKLQKELDLLISQDRDLKQLDYRSKRAALLLNQQKEAQFIHAIATRPASNKDVEQEQEAIFNEEDQGGGVSNKHETYLKWISLHTLHHNIENYLTAFFQRVVMDKQEFKNVKTAFQIYQTALQSYKQKKTLANKKKCDQARIDWMNAQKAFEKSNSMLGQLLKDPNAVKALSTLPGLAFGTVFMPHLNPYVLSILSPLVSTVAHSMLSSATASTPMY